MTQTPNEQVKPLRTRATRQAILAPDLTRYLDRSQLDLAVTDQVQALQVRVRRGLEVFEKRRAKALDAAKLTMVNHTTVIILCAVVAAFAATAQLWISTSAALIAGSGFAIALIRAAFDRFQLRRLENRFRVKDIDSAQTVDEILAIADEVLNTAATLGAVPEETAPKDPAQ